VRKLQSQGVHHITIVGADRQTSIDFWEGVLGMPFVFEQPNLDNAAESHLYFDPGDERLDERGVRHSGVKDRGFMDSIYFEDPLGLLIELASYRFEPPAGHTHADVLLEAHRIRVARDDYNIAPEHLADAIEALTRRSRASLSDED
jgi:hypothetical protein